MVGVLREGQGRQEQGIDHPPLEQVQGRLAGAQAVQVMAQEVVAEDQLGVGGEAVQVGQRRPLVEAALAQEGRPVAQRPDLVQRPIGAGLQVEQEGAGQEIVEPWVHGVIILETAAVRAI